MMNKKKYKKPFIEVLDFDCEDIVTSSINKNIVPNEDEYEGDVIKFNYQQP